MKYFKFYNNFRGDLEYIRFQIFAKNIVLCLYLYCILLYSTQFRKNNELSYCVRRTLNSQLSCHMPFQSSRCHTLLQLHMKRQRFLRDPNSRDDKKSIIHLTKPGSILSFKRVINKENSFPELPQAVRGHRKSVTVPRKIQLILPSAVCDVIENMEVASAARWVTYLLFHSCERELTHISWAYTKL